MQSYPWGSVLLSCASVVNIYHEVHGNGTVAEFTLHQAGLRLTIIIIFQISLKDESTWRRVHGIKEHEVVEPSPPPFKSTNEIMTETPF